MIKPATNAPAKAVRFVGRCFLDTFFSKLLIRITLYPLPRAERWFCMALFLERVEITFSHSSVALTKTQSQVFLLILVNVKY
ncbi:hypothetical protein CEN47_02425 [Fischerella thermalis CCMEE 5319]|nr:hypothetical protein CEN47_02425 [Fischerella thermalis CCMEE 5319]